MYLGIYTWVYMQETYILDITRFGGFSDAG